MREMKTKIVFCQFLIASLSMLEVNAGKISESLRSLEPTDTRTVIIEFPPVVEQVLADPSVANIPDTFTNRDARRNAIVKAAKKYTEEIQRPVLEQIRSLRLIDNCQPFWITNKINLENVDIASILTLASLKENFIIRDPIRVSLHPTISYDPSSFFKSTSNTALKTDPPQWGVDRIRAPLVWEKGNTGTGIVVANLDTGVNYLHEALSTNYANDGFSWFDPFGINTAFPFDNDSSGHGTHTMGTICGTKNGIGVAPGAKWKACKIFDITDPRSGTEGVINACFQWVACPSGDSSKTCKAFPDVVSNSWGGGQGDASSNDAISLLNSMHIFQIFSIGNDGPACNTADSPGDQSVVISVGATNDSLTDTIAVFSSRGTAVGSNILKPEVCAPGVHVLSADNNYNNGYHLLSGTSMACPHVSGTVALMLHANKRLNYNEIAEILKRSARKLPPAKLFGDFTDLCTNCDQTIPLSFFPPVPNNVYGSGRIDAANSVAAATAAILKDH